MTRTKSANVIAVVSIAAVGLSAALVSTGQSEQTSQAAGDKSRSALPGETTRSGADGIPLFTLEFGTVSFGGRAPDDGTIMVVGRDAIGTISNENHTIEVGAVPILIFASTGNGDSDDDGDVDVFDFEGFLGCFSGPGVPYADPSCWVYDMNRDGSVDWTDFGVFQLAFTGA